MPQYGEADYPGRTRLGAEEGVGRTKKETNTKNPKSRASIWRPDYPDPGPALSGGDRQGGKKTKTNQRDHSEPRTERGRLVGGKPNGNQTAHANQTRTTQNADREIQKTPQGNPRRRRWLRHCFKCQGRKSPRLTVRWHIISVPLPEGPGVAISVDYFGHLPVTPRGNTYILLIIDRFSRRPDMFPLPSLSLPLRVQPTFL